MKSIDLEIYIISSFFAVSLVRPDEIERNAGCFAARTGCFVGYLVLLSSRDWVNAILG